MSNDSTIAKIKSVFDRYGVPQSVWYPIAMAESGMDPNAVGDNGASIGIFQINRVGGQGIGFSAEQLRDPVTNAEVAARAITPAYQSVASSVAPSQLAAEVARRSGHPGGSITHPFSAADARIRRIQSIADDYMATLTAPAPEPEPAETAPQSGAESYSLAALLDVRTTTPTPANPAPRVTGGATTPSGSARVNARETAGTTTSNDNPAPTTSGGDTTPADSGIVPTAGGGAGVWWQQIADAFGAIQNAVSGLSAVFTQMGAEGFLVGSLGVFIGLAVLMAMFAETDEGKRMIQAVNDFNDEMLKRAAEAAEATAA